MLIDTSLRTNRRKKPDITTTTAIRMIRIRLPPGGRLTLLGAIRSANSCYHFQIADAASAR